jgi:nitrogen fixation/metabolism regulation signal transduction histidine kinase
MASVADWSRQLIIRSERHGDDHVLVAVQDSGVGVDPNDLDPPFNAFLTTKLGGMGMALSIRSTIEAHGVGYGRPRTRRITQSSTCRYQSGRRRCSGTSR